MTRLISLVPSSENPSLVGYDVLMGPLAFVTTADTVGEGIGDGLDIVGATVTPSERKPRPLKLTVPVRGYELSADPRAAGLRLRRQVRAAFNNARWRLQAYYFTWEPDPDLDCWLIVGGGDLNETDPGISFGEYELELAETFIRGRPGTHRPARRASIVDRRTGLAERDSRRLLYSTDFATQPLLTQPIILPGDCVDLVSSGNRPVASASLGPERKGTRHLWRTASGVRDEILSYMPDKELLPSRKSYLELDELGSVRVWDLSNATPYPPVPSGYSEERDTRPDLFWEWERVMGSLLTPDIPLAMDNGACRVIWLGPGSEQGLAIEFWDAGVGHFVRIGRVLQSLNVREQRVVEVTPERAVLEWRAGRHGMRAILQRGWFGPRLEAYDDGGESARLEYAPEGAGGVSTVAAGPSWVRALEPVSAGHTLLWAQGSADEAVGKVATVIAGNAATFSRTRVLVAQLSCPGGPTAEELASLSLADSRAIPVLVGRE